MFMKSLKKIEVRVNSVDKINAVFTLRDVVFQIRCIPLELVGYFSDELYERSDLTKIKVNRMDKVQSSTALQ